MKKLASTMFVTPSNAEEFSTRIGALFGPLEKDVDEVSLAAEGPLVNGKLEVHPVRPGMRLFTMNVDARHGVDVEIEPASAGVIFSLVLDGSSGYTVQRPTGRHDDPWEFLPGRNIVGTFQRDKSRWSVSGGDSHRLVELHIASGRAAHFVSEYRTSNPGSFPSILGETNAFPSHIHRGLTPELRIIGRQILNCPLQGPARRLFMESKALEILALQLDYLSSSNHAETSIRTKDDRDRLEEARRILDSEFVDPPSLSALARRVGLNDFKLKRGFRELYQTTVFGYVRMLKMEAACSMLQAGELNVSEVAAATGYTCFGHFAAAFRKRFGVAPREFKKARQ
jgi:AraC-like DNA-binding protein